MMNAECRMGTKAGGMDEREALARNLKQLIELDRALGIDFVFKPAAGTAPAPTTEAASPVIARPSAAAPAPKVPAAKAPPPVSGNAIQPVVVAAAGPDSLERVADEIAACRACGLCETRRSTVPGEG